VVKVEISSTEAQNNFGRYLRLAQFEDIIITKNGKKAVVMKSYQTSESETIASSVAEEAADYHFQHEKISYEEFLKFSEESDNRYEYIDGEVYLLASPTYEHQKIVMEISYLLYDWLKGKKCRPLTAPFDITLTKDNNKNVVQPDIVVLCDTENVNDKRKYTGIPTLVVEVLSETTQKKDMLKKLHLYLEGGVKEYWIVNPFRQELYVYTFKDVDIKDYRVYKKNETLQTVSFEGLEIALHQVFES
jgi:prevent-host-death family protein